MHLYHTLTMLHWWLLFLRDDPPVLQYIFHVLLKSSCVYFLIVFAINPLLVFLLLATCDVSHVNEEVYEAIVGFIQEFFDEPVPPFRFYLEDWVSYPDTIIFITTLTTLTDGLVFWLLVLVAEHGFSEARFYDLIQQIWRRTACFLWGSSDYGG